ncbi:MAG: hypothetical protein M5U08_00945 [Burkholderiales bacterium]|nr:hypothetical protein [Burkholderiales bacterium]
MQFDSSLSLLQDMPIPGLYSSIHNCVAFDYVHMRSRLIPELNGLTLDLGNLALRASEDLALVSWPDDVERVKQLAILGNFQQNHPSMHSTSSPILEQIPVSQSRSRLLRFGRRIVTRTLGERWSLLLKRWFDRMIGFPARTEFDSILSAARAADSFYRRARR